jgi:sigma-B regulation protein RsbU (phosphoserine phosphatase)
VSNPAGSPGEDLKALGILSFEELFQSAPCGYAVADKNFRLLQVNAALAEWMGSEPADLVGRHFIDLLSIGGRLYFETHFAPMLRMSGSLKEVALDLTSPNGSRIPVIINAAERRDARGAVLGVLLVLFAASERRAYERDLVEAKSVAERITGEVQSASQLREELVAVLGHDLRNPVFALASGLKILKREPLSARAQRVIGLMEGSVVRATALIENVMDFARARLGGGITLKLQDDTPLRDVIEQVVAEMRLIAPGRQFDVAVEVSSGLTFDPGRFGQLFSNLLANAVVHGAADQPIRLRAVVDEAGLEVAVANGGQPISEEAMAKLFQPFFRGDSGNDKQGLGLGLHIASEIAKAHGGSLTASSSAEETRFTFRMPLQNT